MLMHAGLPSGGDWGLERLGAVRLQGTESVTITGCLFTTLDGNAVFLDGYVDNCAKAPHCAGSGQTPNELLIGLSMKMSNFLLWWYNQCLD